MRRAALVAMMVTLTAAGLLVWPRSADAVLLPLGPVQLVWGSARIVQGHAVAVTSRWEREPGAAPGSLGSIVTDVTLRIDDVLRGSADDALTITVPGGAVGPWRMEVEEAAAFERGGDYLVFLDDTGGVVGWQQGAPSIVDGMVPAFGSSLAAVKADIEALSEKLDRLDARLRTLDLGVAALQQGLFFATGVGSGAGATAGGADEEGAQQTGVGPPPASLAGRMLSLGDVGRLTLADLPKRAWLLPGVDDVDWTAAPGAADVLQTGDDTATSSAGPGLGLTVPAPAPVRRGVAGRVRGPAPPDYPADVQGWMVRGPLDLRGVDDAVLSFWTWRRLPVGLDRLVVACSVDGRRFTGYVVGGDSDGFERYRLPLRDWPLLGDLDGRPQVWVAFGFSSDGLGTAEGVYVDGVRLSSADKTVFADDFAGPGLGGWRTFGRPTWGRSTHRSRAGVAAAYCAAGGARVTAVRPDRRAAGVGATVTIRGTGFGRRRGTVHFFYQHGKPRIRGPVVSWRDDRVVCRVPVGIIQNYYASACSGPLVLTTAEGVRCDPRDFHVTFSYGLAWWSAGRVSYRVKVPQGRFVEAVRRAAATWSGAGADFAFEYGGRTRHDDIATDFHNEIIWRAVEQPGVIAFARPVMYRGHMVEVDQVFNSALSWGDGRGDTMDVETICLHEMGHWLMLRDLYGDADKRKVMYGFGDEGKRLRTLSDGDRDGVRWIYAQAEHDTAPPVVVARPVRGAAGRKVTLSFRIDDPSPSCGWALVAVSVWRDGEQVPADVAGLLEEEPVVRRVGRWATYSFDCALLPGRYEYRVGVRDLAGNPAPREALAELVID